MNGAPDHGAEQQRLLALAARAEPPAQPATDARRMVRRALIAAAGRRKAAFERAAFGLALAALAATALIAVYVRLAPRDADVRRVEVAPPRAAPLRMQLPTHDRLVATPGAQFELASSDPGERRVELRAGAIAFDVAKLAAGQRFVVATPHLRVSVRGTVFSVSVGAQRTEVRVYEGAVTIGRAGAEGTLRAGDSYASDGSSVSQDQTAPLQREAAAMAARRLQSAQVVDAARAQSAAPATPRASASDAIAAATAVARESGPSDSAAAVAPGVGAVEPAVALEPARAADAGESLLQVRAWLHAGQAERALAAARRATAHAATAQGEWLGQWLLVQADALRSLNRPLDAAFTYHRAAQLLPAELRVQAGFKAAEAFLRLLDDPRSALAVLDELGVDAPGSALRERGLLLRIDALERSGAPSAEVAARYLTEYPDSAGAQRLRAPRR